MVWLLAHPTGVALRLTAEAHDGLLGGRGPVGWARFINSSPRAMVYFISIPNRAVTRINLMSELSIFTVKFWPKPV